SKSERAGWERMITTYLEERTVLRAVVAIVDAEVGATAEDVQTLAYLAGDGREVVVAATKLDRLAKARRKPHLAAVAERLSVPRQGVVGFSATEKLGVDAVWGALGRPSSAGVLHPADDRRDGGDGSGRAALCTTELQRLSQLPARQRLEGLVHSPEAAELVRAMPPEQLYATVAEVGLADAAEAVQLASPGQFQALVDLGGWKK